MKTRIRLPEVPPKADHPDVGVVCGQLGHLLGAAVTAPVVDVQHLVGERHVVQHPDQLSVQGGDALHLVVDEDDHRQARRHGVDSPTLGIP